MPTQVVTGDNLGRDFVIDQTLPSGQLSINLGASFERDPATGQIQPIINPAPNHYHVTKAGNDANAGTTIFTAFLTIRAAITATTASGQPSHISVAAGTYIEDPAIIVPPNCVVEGVDQRLVFVGPTQGMEVANMFLCSSGSKCVNMTGTGLKHEPRPDLWAEDHDYIPALGYMFAFAPGAVIYKSPYIKSCTAYGDASQTRMRQAHDPADANPLYGEGMGAVIADLTTLSPDTVYPSFVIAELTCVAPNGFAYTATNGALIELVSCFSYFCRHHITEFNGGFLNVANSKSTFGDFVFVSIGSREALFLPETAENATRTEDVAGADALLAAGDTIIAETYTALAAQSATVAAFTATQEAFTRRDLGTLIALIAADLRGGSDGGTRRFLRGLFDWNGQYVFNAIYLPDFLLSFTIVLTRMKANVAFSATSLTMLAELFAFIDTHLSNPTRIRLVSDIQANSHGTAFGGSGVGFAALPPQAGGPGVARPANITIERDGGQINATHSNETGDTFLGPDIKIDFAASNIEGLAFRRGVVGSTVGLILALGGAD